MRHEGHVGHGRRVLRKGDEAEARRGRPELDLAVAAAGRDDVAAGRVRQRADLRKVVALLLEDVGLGLPLPHEQLAELRAAKREPVARRRDGARVDAALRDRERVHLVEAGHLVQRERADAEADDEHARVRVVDARRDAAPGARAALAQVVAIGELPPLADRALAAAAAAGLGRRRRLLPRDLGRVGVGPVAQLPDRERALLADGVERLGVGVGEEDAAQRRAVARQVARLQPGDPVQRVHAHRRVARAARDEQRVGRPLEPHHVVAVAAERVVQRKRHERALERGCRPHLRQPADGERHVLAVGREAHVAHLLLEVEVVDGDAPVDVDHEQVALVVDCEQDGTIGREREPADVAPRLEWEGERARADEVEARHAVADRAVERAAVGREDEVALAIDGAAEVRKRVV